MGSGVERATGAWKAEPNGLLAGGGPGLSAVLLIEQGTAVVVLTNHDERGGEQIGSRLMTALRWFRRLSHTDGGRPRWCGLGTVR